MKKVKLSKSAIILIMLMVLSIALIATTLIYRAVDAEAWVRHVSRPLRTAITSISNLVPFSITEVVIYLVIVLAVILIVSIIVLLVKRKFAIVARILATILTIALILVSVYTVTASAEYKRAPLEGEWQNADISKEEYLQMATAYQDEYNRLAESFNRDDNGNIIAELTYQEVAKLVKDEMSKYADGEYYASTLSTPKKVLSSELMSYLGISGMYLTLTGEANVNTVTYYTSLPVTIAHELSHSLQIMREDEANIFAFYACLGSQNPLLRYSSLQYGYSQLRNGLLSWCTTDSEEYLTFDSRLSELAKKDRMAALAVWDKYQGWVNDVGEFFNDMYLKISGEKDGTASYVVPGADVKEEIIINPDGVEVTVTTVTFSPIQKIFIYRHKNGADKT